MESISLENEIKLAEAFKRLFIVKKFVSVPILSKHCSCGKLAGHSISLRSCSVQGETKEYQRNLKYDIQKLKQLLDGLEKEADNKGIDKGSHQYFQAILSIAINFPYYETYQELIHTWDFLPLIVKSTGLKILIGDGYNSFLSFMEGAQLAHIVHLKVREERIRHESMKNTMIEN